MLLLLVSSCKDDETQTLVLHTPQQENNRIILNWEQANVSGFQYYMVMRSSDKRTYATINDIVTPTSDAFHKEITTFEDHSYPLGVDTLYYKIMAVGDEIASSKNLCYAIKHPAMFLNGDFRDLYYVAESNKISVLTRDSDYKYKLKAFDCRTGEFSSGEINVDLSSSGNWYFWGEYNGNTEFYNYDSSQTLYVYDASTLQFLTSLQAPSSVWYDPFVSNNKGMIYIYRYSRLYLINRKTGIFTSHYCQNYVSPNKLYYNSKDNKLYAVNYDKIQTFNLDDEGNVVGEEVYTINNNSWSTPLHIENSSLFAIYTNSGDIKFLDMDTKTLHNTDLKNYPILALFHNNVLYISDSEHLGIGSTPYIYRFSADNFKLINTISTRVTPTKFTTDNEYLYFIGRYGYEGYLLDKIKL